MSGLISDEHIKALASQSQQIEGLEKDKARLEKEVDYLTSLSARQRIEMEHLRKRIKMYNTRLDLFFIALAFFVMYCFIAL